MNLVKAIKLLERNISEEEVRINSEITKHKDYITRLEKELQAKKTPLLLAIEELRRKNTVCEKCRGMKTERYTDAAGSGDDRECSACGGTGKVPKGGYRNE